MASKVTPSIPALPLLARTRLIGVTEDVGPVDLVVQGMEAVGRFLLGLAVELPL